MIMEALDMECLQTNRSQQSQETHHRPCKDEFVLHGPFADQFNIYNKYTSVLHIVSCSFSNQDVSD